MKVISKLYRLLAHVSHSSRLRHRSSQMKPSYLFVNILEKLAKSEIWAGGVCITWDAISV